MLHCENTCEDITDDTQAAPQGTKLRITASPERQCAARRDATAPRSFTAFFALRITNTPRAQVYDMDRRLHIVQPVDVFHHVGYCTGIRG